MYGWRAKIGVICPKDNVIVEPELYNLAPDGVSVHSTRLPTVALEEMPAHAEKQATYIAEMGADVVVYACNASSFHNGVAGNDALADALTEASSLPVTTASGAIVAAVEALECERVDLVTPYGEADNTRLTAFLADHGIAVGQVSSLGLAADEMGDLAAVNEETAVDTYDRVLETAAAGDGEATLIVSTNLSSVDTLGAMEADTGKPVVSVNQAMFWHALTQLGISPRIPGYGCLLNPPPVTD